MCLGAYCGDIFFKPDTQIETLKCPCGYEYWDAFQERFIAYKDRRVIQESGRALPMLKDEQRIKKQKAAKDPLEYESCIRSQFILHCIACGLKALQDEDSLQAKLAKQKAGVGFDDQSLIRAMSEILEVARGQYNRRGSSELLQSALEKPVRPSPSFASQQPSFLEPKSRLPVARPDLTEVSEISTSLDRLRTSPSPAISDNYSWASSNIASSPPTATRRHLDQAKSLQSSAGDRSKLLQSQQQIKSAGRHDIESVKTEDLTPRHATLRPEPAENRQLVARKAYDSDVSESEQERRHTRKRDSRESTELSDSAYMFLPKEGIRLDVLKSHQRLRTFGTWTTLEPIVRDKRDGYLIRYSDNARPLGQREIRRLIDDSSRVDDAERKGSRRLPRTS